MYGRSLCILLILTAPLPVVAQAALPNIHITLEDGLAGQKVFNVAEDRQGFLWLATDGGLSRFHGNGFVNYRHDPDDPTSLSNNRVHDIIENEDGTFWVATKSGLDLFDPRTEKFTRLTHDPDDPGSLGPNTGVRHLNRDRGGQLWLSTYGGGLQRKTPGKDRFEGFHLLPPSEMKSFSSSYYLNTIGEWAVDLADPDILWLCTVNNGLGRLDLRTGQITTFAITPDRKGSVQTVYCDREDEVWVGTWNYGLARFTPSTQEWEHFLPHPELHGGKPVSARNIILDLEPKNEDEFWLASKSDGLVVFNRRTGAFSFPTPDIDYADELFVDDAGNLWILGDGAYMIPAAAVRKPLFKRYTSGQQMVITQAFQRKAGELMLSWFEAPGVMVFADGQKRAIPYETPSGTAERLEVLDFLLSQADTLFAIELVSNALIYLDETQQVFRPYRPDLFSHLSAPGRLLGMAEDGHGQLWIRTREAGLLQLPASRDTCIQYAEDKRHGKSSLFDLWFEDETQGWLGTNDIGLVKFHPATGKVLATFDTASPPPYKLRDNWVNDILRDREGLFWVGYETAGFERLPARHPTVPSATVVANKTISGVDAIVEDAQHRVWLLAHNGLFLYDFRDSVLRNVNKALNIEHKYSNWENGLQVLKSGKLAYTIKDQVYVFDPAGLQIDRTPPPMVFTDFQVLGDNGRRIRNINYFPELDLSYQERFFNIGFSVLDYLDHDNTAYAYMLEGWDEQWNHIGNNTNASYSKLPPGRYTFRVKGADGDGVWNENGLVLPIRIRPPWYWNGWTQTLYALLLASVLYAFYRFHLNRRLAMAEAERLKSLDAFKSNLFTNITHEFRTPLTVIQGINARSAAASGDKSIIQRNSQRLLELVNQILDLAKVQAGKLQPVYRQGDILPYLRYVTESFHSLALQQKINLNFYAYEDTLVMDYDPDKILKILSNLIGNALKFTPEYGKIQVTARREKAPATGDSLCLKVKDTGTGIAPENIPHIFSRFQQADASATRSAEGVGIGLALVKELATLLEGEVSVESQPGAGSCFTLYLPVKNTAPKAAVVPQTQQPVEPQDSAAYKPAATSDDSHPRLLIVEDNRDVVQYLSSCLNKDYQLQMAYDGEEGITAALQEVPDIIISDVMMPKADGFELCLTLKQDPRTDHIPIILLTAKADLPSKLSGLEYGADAYLTKPFHEEELHIRLRQLLAMRQRLREKYQEQSFGAERPASPQDAFVAKVKQYILDHLDDEKLGVSALSQAVHLERTQVYRKLKALTGMSATHYIRHIRLQEGAQLLHSTEETVTQIALQVGFRDLAAFSRAFSEAYGQSPTQFRKGLPDRKS